MNMNILTEFFTLAAEDAGWRTEIVNGELEVYVPYGFTAEVCKLFREYVSNFGNITSLLIDSGYARITDKFVEASVNLIRL